MSRDLITSIEAKILTDNAAGSGTDGSVYLGMGGREFLLDKTGDDHEPPSKNGEPEHFVFGEDSNVSNASDNDPRNPQLTTADLDAFPAYLRFVPENDTDDWRIADVSVTATGAGHGGPRYYHYRALTGTGTDRVRLRMGDKYGHTLHLKNNPRL